MVAIGVNQSRIGGKPYGIVLTGIDRPVRVKIQGRYECNNGVQFCACGYRESEWPSGPKGRRFKSCHLDQNRQILSRDLSISLLDYDIMIILHHSPKEFAMTNQDYLSEDEVIKGVQNYLSQKGQTARKRLITKAAASSRQHGVDLVFKLENDRGNGNWYFIEAKGNKVLMERR